MTNPFTRHISKSFLVHFVLYTKSSAYKIMIIIKVDVFIKKIKKVHDVLKTLFLPA
jgi:HJR/Mrr/RecB family endonuclease